MGAEVRQRKTGVSIRTLRPSDAATVTKILQQAPKAANWSGKSFEELLDWSGSVALASEASGELSGILFGRQLGGEAEILNLAVMPERRRLGEGGELLNAALEEFLRRGVSHVFLEVRESNAAAIAFYLRQGFAKSGRRPGYYRDPAEAAIVMEKKLTG
jgi:ribosomal-protein-alanine acetyltransferase